VRLLDWEGRWPAGPPLQLERLLEPRLKEFPRLSSHLELRDGIQFLECRSECVREAPDRPRPEFLVSGLEVQIVHGAGEVFGSFESSVDKCLVDDDLGSDVRQLTRLPGLHLLPHRIGSKLRCIRSTPTEMQSISENDFECLASTGVNTPLNAMFEHMKKDSIGNGAVNNCPAKFGR